MFLDASVLLAAAGSADGGAATLKPTLVNLIWQLGVSPKCCSDESCYVGRDIALGPSVGWLQ